MVNALNLVIKLQNRPWVDKDIEAVLERLFKYFDQNYHEFSSFEKWKAQVNRQQLAWSPVHTEKFWQGAFIFFHDADNLSCIDILVDILKREPGQHGESQETLNISKAVALFDLGEFARFFPNGRNYLENKGAKVYA